MAEQILPQHRAHDQLRTEPAAQREHTDKYVTAFQSGVSTTDITFTDPVLPKSADHFKVGVDELTVNLGKISMLDFGDDDIVFRVLRRGRDAVGYQIGALTMPDGPNVGEEEIFREGFKFVVDRPYVSFQGVVDKLRDVNNSINQYLRQYALAGAGMYDYPVNFTVTGVDDRGPHIEFSINPKGQFVVKARRTFWANFVLQVPLQKYRSIFFDDVDKEFLSLHPNTGADREGDTSPYIEAPAGTYTTRAFVPGYNLVAFQADIPNENLDRVFYASPSLFHTLDRRVTVEVGCSLPLKNSPMIDHGTEAPDYVLGRYMFNKPLSVSTVTGADPNALELHSHGLGTQQLQGPKDRICYHHLKPQQKILTLRLQLWLRVRSYDETRKKWGMRTIVCPVKGPDYWHIRLHFTKK